MKDYINLFYSILDKIEFWNSLDKSKKITLISDFLNIKEDNEFLVNYLDKYSFFLLNNPLKIFTKDIIEIKF